MYDLCNSRQAGLALLIAIAAFLSMSFGQNAPSSVDTGSEIKVSAKKYKFTPAEIRVKKDSHVKLVITALDRDHGFKIEAFHIDQKLLKAEPVTIEFTPDQTGSFVFQCSHFCGLGHKNMKGSLVVE